MAKEQKKNIAVTVDNLHITYRGLKKTSIRASWKNFGGKVELFHALKGVSFEIEEVLQKSHVLVVKDIGVVETEDKVTRILIFDTLISLFL